MKKVNCLMCSITLILLSSILIITFMPCSVSATEAEIDWSTVDWENFQFGYLLGDQTLQDSLGDYLLSEADISLILMLTTRADGEYATWVYSLLNQRFMADPENVLCAIAKEGDEVRQSAIQGIVIECPEPAAMIEALEGIILSPENAEEGYPVLAEIIAFAEEVYGQEITNPKTGDPMDFAVLMAFLSIGGFLLLKRKKL